MSVIRSLRLGALGVGVVGAVALTGVVSAGVGSVQEEPFPHEEHAGLFPVCTGCHTTPAAGDAPGYPEAELCARCHDDVDLPAVSWSGPSDTSSNVLFDHATHAADLETAGEPPRSCESCHAEPDAARMDVEARVVESACFACHAGEPDGHFESVPEGTAECAMCHVPLSDSRFSVERITGLPVPRDHLTGGFVASDHGASASEGTARCATCHTEERCVSCHVDAGQPAVAAMPSAPPDLELPPVTAAYPVPESHSRARWSERHAPVSDAGSCNTCHTTEDCRACHVSAAPAVVDALPRRADVHAPGVGLTASAPGTHESPFFMEAHSTLAAADESTCGTCHTDGYCTDCHDAPAGDSYHPADFVGTHAAAAFGRADECATCHETAAFCRACHLESGFESSGRLGSGYHDAEPVWLLRHGQAARQNLESCASCHQQRDCVQCHGVLGSFRVSPHGPSFDAERAWATSPRTCLACHVGNPVGGS
ncbi:MAG: cytochrome c3 family protein [Gemmatimonadota bacterium]|nr:cytochrome c3 family protein [Gemmatimonadota bacterium]